MPPALKLAAKPWLQTINKATCLTTISAVALIGIVFYTVFVSTSLA